MYNLFYFSLYAARRTGASPDANMFINIVMVQEHLYMLQNFLIAKVHHKHQDWLSE